MLMETLTPLLLLAMNKLYVSLYNLITAAYRSTVISIHFAIHLTCGCKLKKLYRGKEIAWYTALVWYVTGPVVTGAVVQYSGWETIVRSLSPYFQGMFSSNSCIVITTRFASMYVSSQKIQYPLFF